MQSNHEKNLYKEYNRNFDEIRDLEQDDLPRSLRLFNIRIRLAMDIKIGFKGDSSLTKRQEIRDTYALIIKLMELWNAYEALSHYVDEVTDHVQQKVSKAKLFSKAFLIQINSSSIFNKTFEEIRDYCKKNPAFRKDIINYINQITSYDKLSNTLKSDANRFSQYIENNNDSSGFEILSLIYVERNLYYHNGETSKMGMGYSNRQKIILWYKRLMLIHTLKLANFVIRERIDACK